MSPTSTRATPRGMLRWAEISAMEIGAAHSPTIFFRSRARRGAADEPWADTLTSVSRGRSAWERVRPWVRT